MQSRVYSLRPTKTPAMTAHTMEATTAPGPVVIVRGRRRQGDEEVERRNRATDFSLDDLPLGTSEIFNSWGEQATSKKKVCELRVSQVAAAFNRNDRPFVQREYGGGIIQTILILRDSRHVSH